MPILKGRTRETFEAVEREFEVLYGRYIKDQPLEEGTHRSLLMVCLAVATYRILIDEVRYFSVCTGLLALIVSGHHTAYRALS